MSLSFPSIFEPVIHQVLCFPMPCINSLFYIFFSKLHVQIFVTSVLCIHCFVVFCFLNTSPVSCYHSYRFCHVLGVYDHDCKHLADWLHLGLLLMSLGNIDTFVVFMRNRLIKNATLKKWHRERKYSTSSAMFE